MNLMSDTGILFALALAVALFVGGTPALVSAIYFSVAGELNIWLLVGATLLTTVVWDIIWYFVGYKLVSLDRMRGWRVYKRNANLYERILAVYSRHHYLILFLSRFMYGTSTACAVIAGVFKTNFLLYVATCTLSITGQFLALYAISRGIHQNIASVGEPYAIAAAILTIIVFVLVARYAARKFFDVYTT